MNVLLYRFFNINSSYNKITEIIELTKTENEVSQISKDINFYATKNFIAISKENNKFFTLKEIEIIFNLIKNEITYFQNCELDNLLIDENIKLINFKNGDKFQKYNNKEVKFKDIFIDHKIPLFLRKKWPLLSINNKIIAIPFIEKGYYYNPINNKK
jgi:tRNA(Ile)-lysidine synthetase-like protein